MLTSVLKQFFFEEAKQNFIKETDSSSRTRCAEEKLIKYYMNVKTLNAKHKSTKVTLINLHLSKRCETSTHTCENKNTHTNLETASFNMCLNL